MYFPTCPALSDALDEIDMADVEDHPLLVTYESVSGGAQPKIKEYHLRNQSEQVLLIHHRRPAGVQFTCNKRVVVTDVFGHSQGTIPHAKQILSLESLPAGAPNGGPRSFFPPKSSQFLIARYGPRWSHVLPLSYFDCKVPSHEATFRAGHNWRPWGVGMG